MKAEHSAKLIAAVVAASVVSGFAAATPRDTARLQQAWRAAIAKTKAPGTGCYTASYPVTVWRQTACVKAPQRPFLPASGAGGWRGTTGNGNDYTAVSQGLIISAVGSFPSVKNLRSETGFSGRPNTYSLQLNSNFISSPACAGAADPSACQGWQQFAYSSSATAAFMQYWLINYGNACPNGWFPFGKHCYTNSLAISVPLQPIKQLPNMSLSGAVVEGGHDTLVMTTEKDAYSTTGDDSVVYLALGWKGSEFNVVGDGGGSAANFNPGASLTVRIALQNGSRNAPDCVPNSGTTGETNNLTLKACKAKGGKTPSVTFKESLKKT